MLIVYTSLKYFKYMLYIYICCIHLCVCSYFASLWPYFLFKITLAYLSPVSRILTGQPHSNQRLRMVPVLNNKERITNQWIATGWTVPDSLAPRIPQGNQNRTLFFGTSSVCAKKKQKKTLNPRAFGSGSGTAELRITTARLKSFNQRAELGIFPVPAQLDFLDLG